MDSSLEEEIARLSRPPTAENAEPIPALPSSSTSNVTVMPRPINNAAALQQQAREDAAAPPSGATRLRRGSSGSSSGDLSRSGSGRQRSPPRAAGGRRSRRLQPVSNETAWQNRRFASAAAAGESRPRWHPRGCHSLPPRGGARAVLAGRAISELQLPIAAGGAAALSRQRGRGQNDDDNHDDEEEEEGDDHQQQGQQQWQQEQQEHQELRWQQQQQQQLQQQQGQQGQQQQQPWQQHAQQRLGGGSGGIAPNGRSRPARLAANGEKVAGPRPSPLGEKALGFSGGGRASPPLTHPLPLQANPAGSSPAVGKGPSKEEEAWKRSEAALKKKEQSVRNALKEKQRTLQQESLLLATVDRELAQLALDHQTEVNDLRKTLEVVDRELAFLDRDAQRKLEAFEKARSVLSAKVSQKSGITTRLTELILASEKKRDAKLNEIMRKMSTDGAGAAPPPAPSRSGGASYPN